MSYTVALNAVWVVLTAALVLFMEGGFALLEGGLVRTKNVVNVMMKVFADLSIGGLIYFLIGSHLMFGKDLGHLVGYSALLPPKGVPIEAFTLFQIGFAIALISIISGFVSERTRFGRYLIIVLLAVGLVYPISGHWIWGSGGWLHDLGMEDFAGSGAIHALGGFMGLAFAMLVGPRRGKFNPDGSANPMPASSLPLAAAGTFILWFGWFGFNAGSTLDAFAPNLSLIALNTFIAAAAAGITAMLYAMFTTGKADPGALINGPLAGLVGITAGCNFVSTTSAVLIGAVAGVLVMWGVVWADRMHVDDPVGAFAVHGVNGVWGILAVGLFDAKLGLLTTGTLRLLGVQALGIGTVIVWGFGTAYIIGSVLKHTAGLRVSERTERIGLDIALHGAPAYTLETAESEKRLAESAD